MNQLKAKALTQVAQQAWAQNERHKTIALLEKALQREPRNVDTLLKLAAAYGRQRHYDKAETLLKRLLELAPRKANVVHQVAQAYAAIDRPQQAIECYRRCLELYRDKGLAAPALVELAALHERRHELDEAQSAIDEALRCDASNQDALLQQAILAARVGETSRAEQSLRALAENETHHFTVRAQASYELAQLLDDHEQYDDAFQSLLAAKKLLQPHAGPHLRECQLTLIKNREMVDQLDSACVERWRAAAALDEPYRFAVLTGHPRSGTTLIEQVIDAHDDAISADEFDVFTHWIYLPIVSRFEFSQSVLSILDRVPPAVRQQARAAYWKQTEAIFGEPIAARLLVDKNPAMTVWLPVVNWAFPEARLLIALRDPRDVVLSCFMQRLQPNPISVNWLSLAGAAEYYARNMETWLALRRVTGNPWLEFRYEDVVADLEKQARRVLEFLGLPWDDKVLKFYEHARDKMVRSPTYQDVTQPVYQKAVGRWRHYEKYLEPVADRLRPFLDAFGYAV